MKKVLLIILLSSVLHVNGAKLEGFYVTPKFDTVHVLFKVPMDRSGLNLIKLTNGISYYKQGDKKEELVKLKPNAVRYIKIVNKSKSIFELYPMNGTLVQGTMKGVLSCYMSEYRGPLQSMELRKMKSKITVYYLVLNGGERRYFERGNGKRSDKFWIDYLGKDYPEFVECLRWEKAKKDAMELKGKPCALHEMQFEEVISLFNKKYSN